VVSPEDPDEGENPMPPGGHLVFYPPALGKGAIVSGEAGRRRGVDYSRPR
jgi:hypothetical protein